NARLRRELEASRTDVEGRIDGPCTSLAFPYGDFDARVVAATRAARFTAAGALAGRVREPGALTWPRVGIYYKDVGFRFRAKASPAVRRFRATQLWRVRFLLRRRR